MFSSRQMQYVLFLERGIQVYIYFKYLGAILFRYPGCVLSVNSTLKSIKH